jgi:hypothetical protein
MFKAIWEGFKSVLVSLMWLSLSCGLIDCAIHDKPLHDYITLLTVAVLLTGEEISQAIKTNKKTVININY